MVYHPVVGVVDPAGAAYSCPVVEEGVPAVVHSGPVAEVGHSLDFLHILLLQSFYHFFYFKFKKKMVWTYKKLLKVMENPITAPCVREQ